MSVAVEDAVEGVSGCHMRVAAEGADAAEVDVAFEAEVCVCVVVEMVVYGVEEAVHVSLVADDER